MQANNRTPQMYAYGRASTDKQQITLSSQEHVCKSYFNLREATGDVIEWAGWFPDASVTSKISFPYRPMGEKLFRTMKTGDFIIVSNFDRIFRSVIDCDMCMKSFDQRGINMVILDVDVRTDTPLGRAFMKIIAVLKELEREEISRRTREAFSEKRRNGEELNQFAPIGWRSIGTKRNRHIKPSDHDRRLCYRIKKMHEEDFMSLRTVAGTARKKWKEGLERNGFNGWGNDAVRKCYVAAKLGFPRVASKLLPKVSDVAKYMRDHDGQLPRLEYPLERGYQIDTLPPMQAPKTISLEPVDP